MKAKILVMLPSDKFLHRQILEGIIAYGHDRGPWQFHFETGNRYEQGLSKIRRWGCNGIIALVWERKQMLDILKTKTPAVFRNFAFVGTPSPTEWCDRRLRGLSDRLAREGLECSVFPGAPKNARADFDLESPYLAKWLKSLKPKTALYASWDRRALQVLNLCIDTGLSVPGSIAVLGTDNDELLCESNSPSLSSIALDGRNAGNLCAKLLDAHIRGRKVEPLVDLAFPRIVTRQSTDETIVPDRFIAKALAIVRKDLSVNHTVGDLAQTLNISRRTLEMKSNLVLGTTLKSEINRIRLNEAVRLISNTDLPVWAIAEKCGFCCASHLNTRFKAMFGYTPSVFRYQNPR